MMPKSMGAVTVIEMGNPLSNNFDNRQWLAKLARAGLSPTGAVRSHGKVAQTWGWRNWFLPLPATVLWLMRLYLLASIL